MNKKINNKKLINVLILLVFFFYYIKREKLSKVFNELNLDKFEVQNYDIENFLFDNNIRNKSILILELENFHYECTPSYVNYFMEFGYNVDIIINKIGIDAFSLCDNFEKLQIFSYNEYNILKLLYPLLSKKIKKYNFILIETASPAFLSIYKYLGLLDSNKTIFVMHHIDFIQRMNFSKYNLENRIWSLGNFPLGLRVSPHYFGKIKLTDKNKVTTFFITSTINRNYKYIISVSELLRKENLNFKINVVGKFGTFSLKDVPQRLKNYFKFRYNISYIELYKEVLSSDYIIINLNPNNKKDVHFSKIRVSGSLSLAYGFFKPPLINIEFAGLYNLTKNNSLIYDNLNNNFFEIMRKAIILNNKNYKILQRNLIDLSKELYRISLKNIEKSINKF